MAEKRMCSSPEDEDATEETGRKQYDLRPSKGGLYETCRETDIDPAVETCGKRYGTPPSGDRLYETQHEIGTCPPGDRLCEICGEIDFVQYFRRRTEPKELFTCQQAKQISPHSPCPFCRLLHQIANRFAKDPEQNREDVLELSSSVQLRNVEIPGDSNTWQLGIGVQPGRGRELHRWERKKQINFDIVGHVSTCHDLGARESVRVRRVVPDTCNYDLLKSWLDMSPEAEGRTRASIPKAASSTAFMHLLSASLLRVVDVSTQEIVTLRTYPPFLALSYVWGNVMVDAVAERYAAATQQIKSGRLADTELDIEALPKTVRDAMAVISSLGQRYLWVDALCINQHDAEQKAAVVDDMSLIYECALLTIVAVAGKDASAGLPGVTLGSRAAGVFSSVLPVPTGTIQLLKCPQTLADALETSHWNTRAWTLQEHMLSGNCLYFTAHEAFFEGESGVHREAYAYLENAEGSPADRPHNSKKGQRNLRKWMGLRRRFASCNDGYDDKGLYSELVSAYTARNMTYECDRLAAFSGLVRKLIIRRHANRRHDNDPVYEGIPLRYMRWSLGWMHRRASDFHRITASDFHQITDLPGLSHTPASWSWIAWTGPVNLYPLFSIYENREYRSIEFQVIDERNLVGEFCHGDDREPLPAWFLDLATLAKDSVQPTLHLLTPCKECWLEQLDDRKYRVRSVSHADTRSLPNEGLGSTTFESPPELLCGPSHLYELASILEWPNAEKGLVSSWWNQCLLVKLHHDHYERVASIRIMLYSGPPQWQSKYIKLQ